MPRDNSFIPQNTDYTKLLVYKRAECIYALTYAFCEKFLNSKDRTVDQMVQAARSGKQNIVEGMIDGNTSLEMKIKLLNVARGSMHETRISSFRAGFLNGTKTIRAFPRHASSAGTTPTRVFLSKPLMSAPPKLSQTLQSP